MKLVSPGPNVTGGRVAKAWGGPCGPNYSNNFSIPAVGQLPAPWVYPQYTAIQSEEISGGTHKVKPVPTGTGELELYYPLLTYAAVGYDCYRSIFRARKRAAGAYGVKFHMSRGSVDFPSESVEIVVNAYTSTDQAVDGDIASVAFSFYRSGVGKTYFFSDDFAANELPKLGWVTFEIEWTPLGVRCSAVGDGFAWERAYTADPPKYQPSRAYLWEGGFGNADGVTFETDFVEVQTRPY